LRGSVRDRLRLAAEVAALDMRLPHLAITTQSTLRSLTRIPNGRA
jgi:hypothetical protein